MSRIAPDEFRRGLVAGEPLLGTFVKTPHPSVIEVLALSPLDCVCIDTEHAPFDRGSLDLALLAARAGQIASLVRIQRPDAADILNALDLGATGIVVPHISSPETAAVIARAARYGPGGRGYAGSTRAAGYTSRAMTEIIKRANDTVAVIAQIEDAAALTRLDEIASVDGIDALFIGRMDLTVSLGANSPNDPAVLEAVQTICNVAKRHRRSVGMYTVTTAEALEWMRQGASFFLLESDQQWILRGARELAAALRAHQ